MVPDFLDEGGEFLRFNVIARHHGPQNFAIHQIVDPWFNLAALEFFPGSFFQALAWATKFVCCLFFIFRLDDRITMTFPSVPSEAFPPVFP